SDDDTFAVFTVLEEGRQAKECIVVIKARETRARRRQSVYVAGRERLHRAGSELHRGSRAEESRLQGAACGPALDNDILPHPDHTGRGADLWQCSQWNLGTERVDVFELVRDSASARLDRGDGFVIGLGG